MRAGGHWGWVGATVSEKASKNLGFGVGLAIIQSLGKRMAYTSFLAESLLWELHGKEAGCPSPLIWPDPRRGQEPPEGREELVLPCACQCHSPIAGPSPSHTS